MMITYTKLFKLLADRGYSATYWLRTNGISPTIVNKLRKNERVNSDTIDRLCKLLDCQPGDIMEYVEIENHPLT
ncbi:MAG: helix-turn-helix transcriptional regulator [Lachnospiraceae bacterium]|nr:helix-turn-helix transcriptional regulator [Lachnospiraceae bacterium]